jgi:hypothetical protein
VRREKVLVHSGRKALRHANKLHPAQAQATASLPLPVGKGGSVDEVSGAFPGGLNGAGALVDRVLRFINN